MQSTSWALLSSCPRGPHRTVTQHKTKIQNSSPLQFKPRTPPQPPTKKKKQEENRNGHSPGSFKTPPPPTFASQRTLSGRFLFPRSESVTVPGHASHPSIQSIHRSKKLKIIKKDQKPHAKIALLVIPLLPLLLYSLSVSATAFFFLFLLSSASAAPNPNHPPLLQQQQDEEDEDDVIVCALSSSCAMAVTMDGLIGYVNRLQRLCTLLGDYGGDGFASSLPTLWESLPTVVVVGGQSSGKSSVLESIVGRDFLPRGSGIVTRRPLVLQLRKIEPGLQEYAEFLHLSNKKFTDFSMVRKEIQDETDRLTGKSKQISHLPIQLSIYSPNVLNLTLVDLPGLTKVAVEGQPQSIVKDIEAIVRSYVEKQNSLILAITPANQDIATSDAIKLSREADPTGERTFGVLTKLDLMDRGTNAVDVLEGRAYPLNHPWVGIVNRSQADINRNVDMIAARQREREFFATSTDYGHLAGRMGSEYLAKLLSKHLESVIWARMPAITSLINQSIDELEADLNLLGRPMSVDAGAQLYTILELCRAFDRVFKEHLDGGRPGGDRIYAVFDNQLPAALKKLPFGRHLSVQNVRKVVSEADGYQPHLIAPEQGYRRLIEGALNYFRGPAEASVDAVHALLKELVRRSIGETQELRRFPTLQAEIASAAYGALERFREESKKTTLRMVDMESSYLTVDFFRKLPLEMEKGGKASVSSSDRYAEGHFQRIGSNVSSYVGMVAETLRNTIPKAVVHCQVREAKRSLLDHFYTQVGKKEGNQLAALLDEDPLLMERRMKCSRRLELYKSARDEIDSVSWSR